MEDFSDSVPCSSLAVDSVLRMSSAGVIWGTCYGPFDAKRLGLSGSARAAYTAKLVGKYGFSCGLFAAIFSFASCGIQRYRQRKDWVYVKNSRGVQLFTCRWLPLSSPKALVFLCHGYGMECSNFMKGVGTNLASHGFAVFGIDYEGHGRSMGARCYIKRFDNIVYDCSNHFKSICAQEEYREKRRFLYGESMGGAVALLTHKKDPNFWHGAILVAPMCKINEKVKPHPLVISLLTTVEDVIPKWKIVPTKDVIDSAFKDPIKREEIRGNKLIYQQKPRLKTALEMLRTSIYLEDSLNEVTLPFFVLHGEADIVTDPEVSRALYKRASSSDKTIKLYPGMWHGLTAGEPDDNIDIVFSDIISWLDKHTGEDDPLVMNTTNQFTLTDDLTTMASPTTVNSQKPVKRHSRVRYLCGLP